MVVNLKCLGKFGMEIGVLGRNRSIYVKASSN